MLSLADETFLTVSSQAKKRGISVQELLRAVIVPEWVKENLGPRTISTRPVEIALTPTAPQMNPYHRNRIPNTRPHSGPTKVLNRKSVQVLLRPTVARF